MRILISNETTQISAGTIYMQGDKNQLFIGIDGNSDLKFNGLIFNQSGCYSYSSHIESEQSSLGYRIETFVYPDVMFYNLTMEGK